MALKRAVGVSLDPHEAAPSVIVKGAGDEAQCLLDQAERQNVAVVRDPELVAQLYRVPIDAPVGRELFAVMAALLAHVLHADKQHQEKNS